MRRRKRKWERGCDVREEGKRGREGGREREPGGETGGIKVGCGVPV